MRVNLDLSIQLVWAIANGEANMAGDTRIRPVHFLLGILKTIDPFFLKQVSSHLDIRPQQLRHLGRLSSEAKRYLEMSSDEVTAFRRCLRRELRKEEAARDQIVMLHRSDESRFLFRDLGQRSAREGLRSVTSVHLLEELARTDGFDLAAAWATTMGWPEERTEMKRKEWTSGQRWSLLEDAAVDAEDDATSEVPTFGRDMSDLARKGKLQPLIGRKEEITKVLSILLSGKESVAIVGDTGVGKTALIEGVVQKALESDLRQLQFVQVSVRQIARYEEECRTNCQEIASLIDGAKCPGGPALVIEGLDQLFSN